LGAQQAFDVLYAQGCRDFFVSTWWEASRLQGLPADAWIAVLHGLGPNDEVSPNPNVRPVLNSAGQVARWKEAAAGRACDVMIDTGMSRLGLRLEDAGVLDGLNIVTLHSHLACADEDHPLNAVQLERFRSAVKGMRARRYSLANSAGILLGRDFSFDLVRPGLGLYGGLPRPEARNHIRQVAHLEAQIVQRRTIKAGESCGYSALFVAARDTEAAIVNIGYADGYWRGFSARGSGRVGEVSLPVLGRVSMDLVALGCDDVPGLAEGDWVSIDFDLEQAAEASGKSQYELLTGLGQRFERSWR